MSGGWITTVVIIRPSQPSVAGVGGGAELGNFAKPVVDIAASS